MATFSLSLRKGVTNLVRLRSQTTVPPVLPYLPIAVPVLLAQNYVLPVLEKTRRQWRRTDCPKIAGAELVELVQDRQDPPPEWLETGLGILGTWGTVRLASLAAAALGGAAVSPAALVMAGGAALAGTVGSLAASHLRQVALEGQEQTIQLQPGGDLEFVPVEGGTCIYRFPNPAPAKLEVASGSGGEAAVVVPEWWAVRPGADRPQLTITLVGETESGAKTYRAMAIPHYAGPRKLNSPPIPAHERGPFMGELVLRDNSKLRVFASSEGEAKRVLNAAAQWVKQEMLPTPVEEHFELKKLKRDSLYRVLRVEPLRAIYWPKGQRSAAGEAGERPALVWDRRIQE